MAITICGEYYTNLEIIRRVVPIPLGNSRPQPPLKLSFAPPSKHKKCWNATFDAISICTSLAER